MLLKFILFFMTALALTISAYAQDSASDRTYVDTSVVCVKAGLGEMYTDGVTLADAVYNNIAKPVTKVVIGEGLLAYSMASGNTSVIDPNQTQNAINLQTTINFSALYDDNVKFIDSHGDKIDLGLLAQNASEKSHAVLHSPVALRRSIKYGAAGKTETYTNFANAVLLAAGRLYYSAIPATSNVIAVIFNSRLRDTPSVIQACQTGGFLTVAAVGGGLYRFAKVNGGAESTAAVTSARASAIATIRTENAAAETSGIRATAADALDEARRIRAPVAPVEHVIDVPSAADNTDWSSLMGVPKGAEAGRDGSVVTLNKRLPLTAADHERALAYARSLPLPELDAQSAEFLRFKVDGTPYSETVWANGHKAPVAAPAAH